MSFSFRAHTSYYILLAVICAWVIAYVSQLHHDTWRRYSPSKIQTTYNEYIEPQPLSAPAAKAVSFGATEFLADIYWLNLIQYYGGGDPTGEYRKLAELFSTVTDLSPRYQAAYRTGLLVLPGEGFIEEALHLGEKGMSNVSDSWEMPYYTGLVHHIYKKDYAAAAKLFEQAAKLPGAPDNARYLAAIYYNQADQRQTAYAIFITIHQSTDDEFIRERSAKYVGHLEGIFQIEDALTTFKARYNRPAGSLDELVKLGVISKIPTSPLDLVYTYDPTTEQVGESKP